MEHNVMEIGFTHHGTEYVILYDAEDFPNATIDEIMEKADLEMTFPGVFDDLVIMHKIQYERVFRSLKKGVDN